MNCRLLLIVFCVMSTPVFALEYVYEKFEEEGRPTLSYRPDGKTRYEQKYPVTVGILPLRDRRIINFYWDKDDLFEERIDKGIAEILFNEIQMSRIFGSVKVLDIDVPDDITPEFLNQVKEAHDVDMVMITDLVAFHMFRRKAGEMVRSQITVATVAAPTRYIIQATISGQLVHNETATIVWSDTCERQVQDFALMGLLEPYEVGELARRSLQFLFGDFKLLLSAGGKRMRLL
ncbi:MAG: hypothetical protein HOC70_14725 [Gammaproteobacteria bacterium]|jgi:hypothetical protein|nr:hypothetical protein [Gammaproteobacteria bacterium]MBT4494494.1 hypothetical protein [Gammaproteobacteria bacterium]MBT7371704.1 hypothetical protein [Gammaproteobacteria bacterium]